MPLKFGDWASIAQRDAARITLARAEARHVFPDKAIKKLVEWLEEQRMDNNYDTVSESDQVTLIRGWLDSVYEEMEERGR